MIEKTLDHRKYIHCPAIQGNLGKKSKYNITVKAINRRYKNHIKNLNCYSVKFDIAPAKSKKICKIKTCI